MVKRNKTKREFQVMCDALGQAVNMPPSGETSNIYSPPFGGATAFFFYYYFPPFLLTGKNDDEKHTNTIPSCCEMVVLDFSSPEE